MSVSAKLNPLVVIGSLVAVALVAGAIAHAENGDILRDGIPAATRVHTPTKSVDVLDSSTPAQLAVGVSARLYDNSAVAVLADAKDATAQKMAITAASQLRVPVLVDDPAAPPELKRLGARVVLTFGRTRAVAGDRAVPLDRSRAAATISEVRGLTNPRDERRVDAIVITRSRTADAAAVATARNAGAEVLELPDADPRRTPAAAKAIAARPRTPVIALGKPFSGDFAYALAVVRTNAVQPTGGYLALPGKHYTAMYGHPGAPSLGVLGEQGVRDSIKRVERIARSYRRVGKADFVPTFEIIATVASAGAGKDKNYSHEAPVNTLTSLVDAAEKAGVYVILDLQPGRTDFLTQAKRYRRLLERPHVGLALDPEWRLKRKQKHLRQIGSVDVAEINRVSDWLAALTRREVLPQKLFVLHEFSPSMIKHRGRLDTGHIELATVIHVDGSGPQGAKQSTWRTLRRNAPADVHWGWKNFFDEDEPHMLTAKQTWRDVNPHPSLISYQ